MNLGRSRLVPRIPTAWAVVALTLAFGGCFGRDLTADPAVVAGASPERLGAVAEIRQRAEAADEQPFPNAFQAEQSARLAARAEPRAAADADEIEAELAAIAQLQQAATTPGEIAELQARADALRRKSAQDQAGRVSP